MSHNVRFAIVGFSVLVLCAACGGEENSTADNGQNPPPPPPSQQGCPALPASTLPRDSLGGIVDAAVATEMTARGMPGMTVAVAKNGTILYAQGYGYSDLASCRPMQATEKMHIGSITKQFTAAAVLQLRETGLIDIDRTVASYLPGYAFDPRITVRMLLNQTSGLQDYLDFPSLQQYAASGAPQSTVLSAVVQTPLNFPPGTAYQYSNSNYYILGSVIEAVSSQTYEDYLASNVLTPAGLSNTSYLQPPVAASGYAQSQAGVPQAATLPHSSAYFSAGQLWSNVQDLALWDAALLGGQVIPQAAFNEMLTPAAVPYFGDADASNYGMGWLLHSPVSGHAFVWHNGGSTAYTSFNGLLTDAGFSVTVLANSVWNENVPLLDFGTRLIHSICNAPAAGGC
jgi:D-alanyl-D-alanine carboxypeptidase